MTSRGHGSQMAALTRKIKAAGGEVEITKQGHLRVRGPLGVAIVGGGSAHSRSKNNAKTTLARYAGIILA